MLRLPRSALSALMQVEEGEEYFGGLLLIIGIPSDKPCLAPRVWRADARLITWNAVRSSIDRVGTLFCCITILDFWSLLVDLFRPLRLRVIFETGSLVFGI